jgi:DNA-binding HxlR family transcriptional regulator
MRWSELARQHCSVARTLSVIGDRWTLLVLRQCFLRTRRFGDFLDALGISRPLLKERLDKLVDEGVLERVLYQERPPRHEYRLTEKGLDLYPVVTAMLAWGDRWMVDADGPPLVLTHRPCGHDMVPEAVCPHCHRRIDPHEVDARFTKPARRKRRAVRKVRAGEA